jgi:uncharacterized protein (TIGR03067 family)
MFLRLTALALLLGAWPVPAAPLPFHHDRSEVDAKAAQGEWQAISFWHWKASPLNGRLVKAACPSARFVVTGREFVVIEEGGGRVYHEYRLHGSRGLGRIDTVRVRHVNELSPEPGRWDREGVYRLDGDTLIICDGPEGSRPKDLSGGQPDQQLIVLKRAKPRP